MSSSRISTESELLMQLSKGKDKAFESLFLKYFPKVKLFIAQLLKNDVAAEELAQDIFVKLWENRKDLIKIQSFSAYIYKMAKNAVINHLEHRQVEEKYARHYESLPKPEVAIEEDLFAKELELLVMLTVQNMPEQRRKVYEMSRIEGLKNDEIASRLQLSQKTIENHLNLALKEIKKTISVLILFFF